jgi:hypothetical protein
MNHINLPYPKIHTYILSLYPSLSTHTHTHTHSHSHTHTHTHTHTYTYNASARFHSSSDEISSPERRWRRHLTVPLQGTSTKRITYQWIAQLGDSAGINGRRDYIAAWKLYVLFPSTSSSLPLSLIAVYKRANGPCNKTAWQPTRTSAEGRSKATAIWHTSSTQLLGLYKRMHEMKRNIWKHQLYQL